MHTHAPSPPRTIPRESNSYCGLRGGTAARRNTSPSSTPMSARSARVSKVSSQAERCLHNREETSLQYAGVSMAVRKVFYLCVYECHSCVCVCVNVHSKCGLNSVRPEETFVVTHAHVSSTESAQTVDNPEEAKGHQQHVHAHI